MEYSFCYETELGKIRIVENGTAITQLGLDYSKAKWQKPVWKEFETPRLRQAAEQLNAYLAGERLRFSVELAPQGTEFQQKVWKALLTIPYGEVRSYLEIAKQIGSPKAARAVGMANNRNPIMILIPCHRVIGSNGSLVGYACGLEIKRTLLIRERKYLQESGAEITRSWNGK